MSGLVLRVREWLFGPVPVGTSPSKLVATSLIQQIAHRGVRSLSDNSLMALVGLLLDNPGLRTGLRGNARFLESVSRQYAKKRRISPKQRLALCNILERAYPHNLAATLSQL